MKRMLRSVFALLLTVALLCAAAPITTLAATTVIDPSDADRALYARSYQSLLDRTQESGYAATSLTGAYKGMYVRDAAVQVMAMTANGDLKEARKVLEYILDYHAAVPAEYALHILPEAADLTSETLPKPLSAKMQTDTTYLLLHAAVQWYNACGEEAEQTVFLERYWVMMKTFADYFLQKKYYNDKKQLIVNPNFQHRDRTYNCYDLYTNVFASQTLHELAPIATARGEKDTAKRWNTAANNLKTGIHKNLVRTYDGKKVYMEMLYARELGYITGFSFVNLAPVAAGWFGTDAAILKNTYQKYLRDAAKVCDGVTLLDTQHVFDSSRWRNETLGKLMGWELLYCAEQGDSERLRALLDFMATHTGENDPYPESWKFDGKTVDPGNQEQVSWLVYALASIMPQIMENGTVSSAPPSSSPSSAAPSSSAVPETLPGEENQGRILFLFCAIAGVLLLSIAVVAFARIRENRSKKKAGRPENPPEKEPVGAGVPQNKE